MKRLLLIVLLMIAVRINAWELSSTPAWVQNLIYDYDQTSSEQVYQVPVEAMRYLYAAVERWPNNGAWITWRYVDKDTVEVYMYSARLNGYWHFITRRPS